jgi:hypothetical protein
VKDHRETILAYDREDGWEDILSGTYPQSRPKKEACGVSLADRLRAYNQGAEDARRTRQ